MSAPPPPPPRSQHIFNVNTLDLSGVSKGFGFEVPPRVNLNISATGEGAVKKRGGGGGFGDPAKRKMSDFHDPKKRQEVGGDVYVAVYSPCQNIPILARPPSHIPLIPVPLLYRLSQAIIKAKASSGHAFSASNPYGKRPSGDARQFSH